VIVLNGYLADESEIVEVVDLKSPDSVCLNLPKFPLVARGTFGGTIDGGTPLVCGGRDSNDCYVYKGGQWSETFSMNENRFHFTGMVGSPFQDPSHKFFVLAPSTSGTKLKLFCLSIYVSIGHRAFFFPFKN